MSILARVRERGASSTEYALLIAGVAAVLVIAAFALGPLTTEMFADTCDGVSTAQGITATCDS